MVSMSGQKKDVDGNTAFSGYPMSLNQANLDSAWTRLRRITRSWSGDFLAPAKFAKPGSIEMVCPSILNFSVTIFVITFGVHLEVMI